MKLSIPSKELRDAVAKLSHIPGSFGAAISTQAVRFEAGLAGLVLTRFTSEACISLTIDSATVEDEEGELGVDHNSLTTLLSRMPGETIELSLDGKHLLMESGPVKAKLHVFGEEMIAEAPDRELETEFDTVLLEDLNQWLHIVAPAMCKDDTKPQFGGVCFRPVHGKFALTTTNGKQMHLAYGSITLPVDCTLPSGGVEAVRKVIEGESGPAKIAIGDRTFNLISEKIDLSVALMEDKFPNIEAFLKGMTSSIKSKMTISRDELTKALKACAVVGEGDAKFVWIDIKKDKVQFVGDNLRDSKLSITVACEATAPARIMAPALQVVQGLDVVNADDKGNVEFLLHDGNVGVIQDDRLTLQSIRALPPATKP